MKNAAVVLVVVAAVMAPLATAQTSYQVSGAEAKRHKYVGTMRHTAGTTRCGPQQITHYEGTDYLDFYYTSQSELS